MSEATRNTDRGSPAEQLRDTRRVVVATIMPPAGPTGVQTHIHEVCAYLASRGHRPEIVTPYSWGGPLSIPVFGARRAIDPLSGAASIAWYRYWHYAFLKRALEHTLASEEPTVVYAQCALSAKAAIEARRSAGHQGGRGHPLRRLAGRRMGRQEDAARRLAANTGRSST